MIVLTDSEVDLVAKARILATQLSDLLFVLANNGIESDVMVTLFNEHGMAPYQSISLDLKKKV